MEDIKRKFGKRNNRFTKDWSIWHRYYTHAQFSSVGNRTYKDSMKKTYKEFLEACWDTHKQVGFKMKGGKRVPNCVPKNENKKVTIQKGDKRLSIWDAELRTYQQMGWELISELGPAAMARRKRMRARMGMLQKKYSDARKAGIHPSRVSQRHNKMTVKKR